jgi:hypothetical protein
MHLEEDGGATVQANVGLGNEVVAAPADREGLVHLLDRGLDGACKDGFLSHQCSRPRTPPPVLNRTHLLVRGREVKVREMVLTKWKILKDYYNVNLILI